jgi:primosomal protein N' (replication factor Y)
MLVSVAVKSVLRKLLTYEAPHALERGVRVRVPFRSRELMGVVWGPSDERPTGTKSILQVLDEKPFFDAETLQFYEKAAQYYGLSLGELLGASVPKKIQDGGDIPAVEAPTFSFQLVDLNEPQQNIVEAVSAAPGFSQHLIMGETGSGKTEVYLHAIARVLKAGGQALFLLPEISLTPQMEDRLSQRLGTPVVTFHSQLTEKKRLNAFARARSGLPHLFLGARSALFLPFTNLKMIVVDEEHDMSYKQAERAAYHARDLAILRSQIFRIPILLGSATPSLETYHRHLHQKLPIYELAPFHARPEVVQTVVSLREEWKQDVRSFLSRPLQLGVENCLTRGDQALIFLNRRGSASQRTCVTCGHVEVCRQCSVTLTVHRDHQQLICHWCGFRRPLKSPCSHCDEKKDFFEGGVGTKQIEAELKERFPEAKVARLDRDEAHKTKHLETIIRQFVQGKIDILVGTQMISKGIDIPKLSFVGMVLADMGWGIPDFRGTEKSFQLLKQVRGRVGRRGQRSEVVIQTFFPEHPVFEWIAKYDAYQEFFNAEMPVREMGGFPPVRRLALWTLQHKSETQGLQLAQTMVNRWQTAAKDSGVDLWGPSPAPLSRWKGMYRFHLLCRAAGPSELSRFLPWCLQDIDSLKVKGLSLKLDRDPQGFF